MKVQMVIALTMTATDKALTGSDRLCVEPATCSSQVSVPVNKINQYTNLVPLCTRRFGVLLVPGHTQTISCTSSLDRVLPNGLFSKENHTVHELGTNVYSRVWRSVLPWPHQNDFVYQVLGPCTHKWFVFQRKTPQYTNWVLPCTRGFGVSCFTGHAKPISCTRVPFQN